MKQDSITETTPAEKPTAAPAPEHQALIRVLKHGTKIGSLRCAVGHQQRVPLSAAEQMKKLGLADIIGI